MGAARSGDIQERDDKGKKNNEKEARKKEKRKKKRGKRKEEIRMENFRKTRGKCVTWDPVKMHSSRATLLSTLEKLRYDLFLCV